MAPGQAAADESLQPEIKNIIVTTSDSDLLLFATVKNCFTQEMIEGMHNNVPIVFTFQLELTKIRTGWIDEALVEKTITHTMSYDRLKEEYTLSFSEPGATKTTRSLDQAKQLMAELTSARVIALDHLIPDAPYAIRFKVTLKKGTLPFGMNHILPFTTFWNFETDWRTIEFRY